MSEPFLGEIKMFAGNFAIRGWAFCDGQLLAIAQNQALFSLFGTTYGGDGETTFGLPDLRGRLPVHVGTGPGLSTRALGSKGGDQNVTLTANQVGSHSHAVNVSTDTGQADDAAAGGTLAASPNVRVFRPTPPGAPLDGAMVANAGSSIAHANEMPYLCINFLVALVGIFPSES